MNKVALFSVLLILGLFGSQWLPPVLGRAYGPVSHGILLLTMIALSFIMIHVGYEFELDKSNPDITDGIIWWPSRPPLSPGSL
jgi:hypothetical protein